MSLIEQLHLLYQFISSRAVDPLPVYDQVIEQQWKNKNLCGEYIRSLIVRINQAQTTFKHRLGDVEICSYNYRCGSMLEARILLDSQRYYMYVINMKLIDYYKFLCGVEIKNLAYMSYKITLKMWSGKMTTLIKNDKIVCADVYLHLMFQEIPNSRDIPIMQYVKRLIENRYDHLKQLKCLEQLPFELIGLIQKYCTHDMHKYTIN